MTELDGLRETYGNDALQCESCGHLVMVSDIIDSIEHQEVDTLFVPEKIKDLAFARCEVCGDLQLHERVENYTIGAEDQSEADSKPKQDADGQSEPSGDSQSGSNKPFSIT